jgi:hypothetical protein
MSRSRNDDELLFAGQLCECRAVELNDLDIIPADDEERRCSTWPVRHCHTCGTTASRNDRVHVILALGYRNQRGGGTGTGAKIADREALMSLYSASQSVAPTSRSAQRNTEAQMPRSGVG